MNDGALFAANGLAVLGLDYSSSGDLYALARGTGTDTSLSGIWRRATDGTVSQIASLNLQSAGSIAVSAGGEIAATLFGEDPLSSSADLVSRFQSDGTFLGSFDVNNGALFAANRLAVLGLDYSSSGDLYALARGAGTDTALSGIWRRATDGTVSQIASLSLQSEGSIAVSTVSNSDSMALPEPSAGITWALLSLCVVGRWYYLVARKT